MSWLLRLVLFVPIIWLIMVVYAGQKETNAKDTLRSAGRKTFKFVAWSVALVGLMLLLEAVFI